MLKKILTIALVLVILGALGDLVYIVSNHMGNEKFTNFYILGLNRQASDYPSTFFMPTDRVTSVQYGEENPPIANQQGVIFLGITNREQQETSYTIVIKVDGNPVKIGWSQKTSDKLGPITLQPDKNWEGEITFAPEHKGDHQKVEFLLYKNEKTESDQSLHIWIDVK